jgi:hypothetical protein
LERAGSGSEQASLIASIQRSEVVMALVLRTKVFGYNRAAVIEHFYQVDDFGLSDPWSAQ